MTTVYEYNDPLDRLTKVAKWNSYINYVYNGTRSVVSYEKQADNWDAPTETDTDGLGRVITVYEDPNGANYAASYFYDPLGDLTGVVQGYCPSCQSRTFAYDSLQRVTG